MFRGDHPGPVQWQQHEPAQRPAQEHHAGRVRADDEANRQQGRGEVDAAIDHRTSYARGALQGLRPEPQAALAQLDQPLLTQRVAITQTA